MELRFTVFGRPMGGRLRWWVAQYRWWRACGLGEGSGWCNCCGGSSMLRLEERDAMRFGEKVVALRTEMRTWRHGTMGL